jgi:methionine synthase I (cobalamin-dependent)
MFELRVAGGCCGTDHEHVAAIAEALVATDRTGAAS